ncbi:hypothetical protein [Absidia glauca]|uniref:RIC1 C-terminal alpha solenoid region domain-containing protein n=1 Tax=Absidia glauca TaxID=4829 RepID=A0A168R9R2_ABSGL|nr:hypothetical protein [Absidia glauca]
MYWIHGIASELCLTSAIRGSSSPTPTTAATTATDPPKDTSHHPSHIIAMQPSQHASLFITCTSRSIYLWSVKPTSILSFVDRSTHHVTEFGQNKSVLWKPDATAFVVLTDRNYLLLYTILSYDQPSFEFEFPRAHAYVTGPGEGKGVGTMIIKFRLAIRVDAGVVCGTCSDDTLIIATHHPAAIQCISWQPQQSKNSTQTAVQQHLGILIDSSEYTTTMVYDKQMNISVWITQKGRVYFVQNHHHHLEEAAAPQQPDPSTPSFSEPIHWSGTCFHGNDTSFDPATSLSINAKFSLIAVGTESGAIYVYSVRNYTTTPALSHQMKLPPMSMHEQQQQQQQSLDGRVQSLAWSLDGYALSVGFLGRGGLAVWSVYGALLCSMNDVEELIDHDLDHLQDTYIHQINHMFWGPGSHQLFILAKEDTHQSHLYTLPFAKSALTSFHNSESNNTNTIDPDAVAWTHILYPTMYITDHWPIRYASISSDGKFIAVAGRRGLAHFSTISNRWKLFGNQQQEQHLLVRGGLVWFKTILIVGCEWVANKTFEIHLYSRDQNLDLANSLHTEPLHAMLMYMTVCGNTLLVYTVDNLLSVYSIQWEPVVRLDLVRQLSLTGIVARAGRVRGISLFHGDCGDRIFSVDEITVASILLLVDGNLMMLTPKFPNDDDDSDLTSAQGSGHWTFDLHVLMEKVEYYWVGQKSIANLWTSIWAVDGQGVKVFTNVLRGDGYGFQAFSKEMMMTMTTESEPSTPTTPSYPPYGARPYSLGHRIGIEPTSPHSWLEMEGESRWQTSLDQLEKRAIYIPLDFYPHAVLLEKGILVGMEQNIVYRETLGFLQYKSNTKTHLFIHHLIRHLLQNQLEEDAVVFARAYERLVYFGHALEILLHTVLEEEAEKTTPVNQDAILPLVIRFLDQFPHALDVIVSCARKTEVALWDHLFSSVGKPEDLFELCLADGRLRTATSYLIILQTMQPMTTGGKDTIRLLRKAMELDDYELCKELVRFLSSIDHTGKTLHEALSALTDAQQEQQEQEGLVQAMQAL